jgi:hypothetical protein
MLGGLMSILQKETLKRFRDYTGRKTLDEYSVMTGIERTRLFRLMHGAEMKLSEFEILQSFLAKKFDENIDWQGIIKEVEEDKAAGEVTKDFRIQWERERRLGRYLEESQKVA